MLAGVRSRWTIPRPWANATASAAVTSAGRSARRAGRSAASASAEPPLNELDAAPNDVELDDAEPDDAEPDDADPNDAERSDSELDTVDDGIDLERLSELLAERLSNLELPPRLD